MLNKKKQEQTMKNLIKLIFLLVAVVVSQERPISTYSIVAYDESTGELGVAVQSHWFSVGSIVPWAKAGIGAVATQSFARVEYGPDGLRMMEEGLTAGLGLDFGMAGYNATVDYAFTSFGILDSVHQFSLQFRF